MKRNMCILPYKLQTMGRTVHSMIQSLSLSSVVLIVRIRLRSVPPRVIQSYLNFNGKIAHLRSRCRELCFDACSIHSEGYDLRLAFEAGFLQTTLLFVSSCPWFDGRVEMNSTLRRIESRLNHLTKSVRELKSENEILRKEILGVSSSQNSDEELMETRTLREIVEQTEFCVNKINSNILKNGNEKEYRKKSKPRKKAKTMVREESDSKSFEESPDEFPVVEIRSKTLADEREILKETFNKVIKEKEVKDGESLQETSVHTSSNSIPLSTSVVSCCAMTLSNYLDSALTDPQYHFYQGSRKSGPTRVVENFSEVFYFSGEDRCQFLCSFAIRKTLRLTICCLNYSDGTILFGIGFTPADVPTDQSLFRALYSMPPATDVWMTKPYSKTPVELFVTRRNLLVRGHMTTGPRSIVHVEIMRLLHISWPISVVKGNKRLTDGKSFEFNECTKKDGSISRSVGKIARFSCNVEIANFLNVPLRNGNKFYSNSKDKDFWPLEIQSFQRETIFGSSDTNLKAMFSYEIVSTDLALVIALKVGPGSNSFAAAFSQIPAFTEKKDLKALMNPSEWKIHDYKKCSDASKTVEVIRDRNIRAEILMTEEENSILKIHIYVV